MLNELLTNTSAVIALITLGGAAIYAIYQILKDFFDFENRRIREANEKDALSAL